MPRASLDAVWIRRAAECYPRPLAGRLDGATTLGGTFRDRPALPRQAAELREQERPRTQTAKRHVPTPVQRIALASIESPPGDDDVLGPSEVAQLLGVHPKTVTCWATQDGLPSFRTVGGRRRLHWRT